MNTWESEHVIRIGTEIKRLRGKRPAAWLADMTEKLGLKLTRQTITDLENGRRRYVTTAELLVLAAALNTSPVTLMFPGPYTREIEALPGRHMLEFTAAQWFSGIQYWTTEVAEARNDGNFWLRNTRRLRLFRDLELAHTTRNTILARGEFDKDRDQIAFYDAQIQRFEREIEMDDDA